MTEIQDGREPVRLRGKEVNVTAARGGHVVIYTNVLGGPSLTLNRYEWADLVALIRALPDDGEAS